MEKDKLEKVIKNLIEVFFNAGKLSIDLRNKGLNDINFIRSDFY